MDGGGVGIGGIGDGQGRRWSREGEASGGGKVVG
jgi:hypothetical protein